MTVQLKRIYDEVDNNDGLRILVDRVWPRGVSKEKAQLDYWLKDIGPSKELRQWFGHDPEKFETFKENYKEELQQGTQNEAWQKLKELADDNHITLVFASKDDVHNQAQVLKTLLKDSNI